MRFITSDPSGLFNWTTEGCCAPPDNFMPGFIGSNIANVTWSPVLAATGYEVQVSVSGTGNWTSFPPAEETRAFAVLSVGRDGRARMRALIVDGERFELSWL